MGWADTAGYAPAVQEMAALVVTQLPVGEASVVWERLTGVKPPRAPLDREAPRQGQRAPARRRPLDRPATAPPQEKQQPELGWDPCQMILQIDAWNMRERDAWGVPAARRGHGQEPGRWHWVYPGTVFGLDHRGQTAGGRPVTSERGFVATRAGSDGVRAQLPAEALRRGRGQAAGALVIADGAVGIWRLAHDRFPPARQRLDFYRAAQHLAAVGRALFGEGAQQLKAGLPPWVQQRKNESAGKGIRQWEDLLQSLPPGPAAQAVVRREGNYLHAPQARRDDRAGRRRGEPIGSGPVEATCRRSQGRFKRPGQFWSATGNEALLRWEMLWRNGRRHLLFPHAAPFAPAKN